MNKVFEIVSAWAISIRPSEKQKERALKRYAVCLTCEHRVTTGIERCKLCTCPLKGKIFTLLTPEEGNCEANKWDV